MGKNTIDSRQIIESLDTLYKFEMLKALRYMLRHFDESYMFGNNWHLKKTWKALIELDITKLANAEAYQPVQDKYHIYAMCFMQSTDSGSLMYDKTSNFDCYFRTTSGNKPGKILPIFSVNYYLYYHDEMLHHGEAFLKTSQQILKTFHETVQVQLEAYKRGQAGKYETMVNNFNMILRNAHSTCLASFRQEWDKYFKNLNHTAGKNEYKERKRSLESLKQFRREHGDLVNFQEDDEIILNYTQQLFDRVASYYLQYDQEGFLERAVSVEIETDASGDQEMKLLSAPAFFNDMHLYDICCRHLKVLENMIARVKQSQQNEKMQQSLIAYQTARAPQNLAQPAVKIPEAVKEEDTSASSHANNNNNKKEKGEKHPEPVPAAPAFTEEVYEFLGLQFHANQLMKIEKATGGDFYLYLDIQSLAEQNAIDIVDFVGDRINKFAANENDVGLKHLDKTEVICSINNTLHKLEVDYELKQKHNTDRILCVKVPGNKPNQVLYVAFHGLPGGLHKNNAKNKKLEGVYTINPPLPDQNHLEVVRRRLEGLRAPASTQHKSNNNATL